MSTATIERCRIQPINYENWGNVGLRSGEDFITSKAVGEPFESEITDGCVTFPLPCGNEGWQVWKPYPKQEGYYLEKEFTEPQIAALPNRTFNLKEYFENLRQELFGQKDEWDDIIVLDILDADEIGEKR